MRTLGSKIGLLALAALLAGCPLLKKKSAEADAEADAAIADDPAESVADAATVEVTGTGAKNEKDVLRYAKEEKLDDEVDELEKDMTVRAFPNSGKEVAKLPKGTSVVKIARYFNTAVLIVFDDPSGDGKLMGWVPPESFLEVKKSKPAATATAAPTAPQPTARVDAGAAVDPKKDAGAPVVDPKKDAGAPAVDPKKDAGAPPPPPPPPAATEPKRTDITWPPTAAGKCPAGFTLVTPLCRRSCGSDAGCPRGTFCITKMGKKYCSTDKQ